MSIKAWTLLEDTDVPS